MSRKIDIDIGGISVGCIIFDEAPVQLIAHRTATGFNLSIPATIELKYADSSKPCPMLRGLQVAENILVEIPLPSEPPAPWDEVWKALVEARDAFEQGGTTG